MIAIVDYGMGNLRSVEKGFLKAGVDAVVTNSPNDIRKADGVVLPGVGAFKDCMRELTHLDLVDAVVGSIREGKPYLGICLGLQVLFSESEEFGRCRGLDIFRGKVKRFRVSGFDTQGKEPFTGDRKAPVIKVPHMGWNEIRIRNETPLLHGIPDGTYFYFVHSFYVEPERASIVSATTEYGIDFVSMISVDNVYAVQFHPEKSQAAGMRLLRNFGDIVRKAR